VPLSSCPLAHWLRGNYAGRSAWSLRSDAFGKFWDERPRRAQFYGQRMDVGVEGGFIAQVIRALHDHGHGPDQTGLRGDGLTCRGATSIPARGDAGHKRMSASCGAADRRYWFGKNLNAGFKIIPRQQLWQNAATVGRWRTGCFEPMRWWHLLRHGTPRSVALELETILTHWAAPRRSLLTFRPLGSSEYLMEGFLLGQGRVLRGG